MILNFKRDLDEQTTIFKQANPTRTGLTAFVSRFLLQ